MRSEDDKSLLNQAAKANNEIDKIEKLLKRPLNKNEARELMHRWGLDSPEGKKAFLHYINSLIDLDLQRLASMRHERQELLHQHPLLYIVVIYDHLFHRKK